MVDRARGVRTYAALATALVTPFFGAALAHCSGTDKPSAADTTGIGDATAPRLDAGRDSRPPPESSTASDGSACDAGQTFCGGACTDTNKDPTNCGQCGNACGMGVSCIAGQCNCIVDAGQTLCNGACVLTAMDPGNCGACSHACQGSTCLNGLCQSTMVAQGGANVVDIAVDDTDMYWTQGGTSAPSVNKKAFAGTGSGVALVTGSDPLMSDPRGVAVDGLFVYWVDYATGAVERWDKMSGALTAPIVVPPPDAGPLPDGAPPPDAGAAFPSTPNDIAVDADNVYWVSFEGGQVLRAPRNGDGGSWVAIASGEDHPIAIAVDDTNVYWVDYGGTQAGMGFVKQAPKTSTGGSGTIVLAQHEARPWDIAIDRTNVYWTNKANPGEVKKNPIGVRDATVTLAPPPMSTVRLGAPYGIAVDQDDAGGAGLRYIYWTNYDDNTVMRLPIDADGGQQPFVLASGQNVNNPAAIAVKDNNVYWVNAGPGTIYKVAK